MFEIKAIRDDPELFDAAWAKRGLPPAAAKILEFDERRRAALTKLQSLQQRRNDVSRRIGQAKAKGEGADHLIDEVANLKKEIPELEEDGRQADAGLSDLLASLPNLPDAEVPEGADENANVEIRRVGDPLSGGVQPHYDVGEALGLMDFERAAKLSGARFVVLYGALARLERALAAFMLDVHTQEYGYTEVSPPLLVRDRAAFGTGNLPKFADDLFRTRDGMILIPTAEMVLTNLVADEILDAASLPLRYTAYTHVSEPRRVLRARIRVA